MRVVRRAVRFIDSKLVLGVVRRGERVERVEYVEENAGWVARCEGRMSRLWAGVPIGGVGWDDDAAVERVVLRMPRNSSRERSVSEMGGLEDEFGDRRASEL